MATSPGSRTPGEAQETLEAYLGVGREVPGFEVYSGPDHLVPGRSRNGAKGCISGLGNVMPEMLAGIVSGIQRGRHRRGGRGAGGVRGVSRTSMGLGYPPALVKRALFLMDNSVGASRQPALLPIRPGRDDRGAAAEARTDRGGGR